MRIMAWTGQLLLAAGILLGALLAGGMYAAEGANRAQVTPAPIGPVEAPAPVTLQGGTGDATKGRAPYERSCAGCHGTTGRSDTPLHGPLLKAYYPDDRVLAGLIRNGVGTMPGTPTEDMSDQDVTNVIAYMRSFP